jgi:hypothetical protein
LADGDRIRAPACTVAPWPNAEPLLASTAAFWPTATELVLAALALSPIATLPVAPT